MGLSVWCFFTCDFSLLLLSVTAGSCTVHLQNTKDQTNVVFWLGVLCVFASLCALMLPETRGRITPDTIEEVRIRKFKKIPSLTMVNSNSAL